MSDSENENIGLRNITLTVDGEKHAEKLLEYKRKEINQELSKIVESTIPQEIPYLLSWVDLLLTKFGNIEEYFDIPNLWCLDVPKTRSSKTITGTICVSPLESRIWFKGLQMRWWVIMARKCSREFETLKEFVEEINKHKDLTYKMIIETACYDVSTRRQPKKADDLPINSKLKNFLESVIALQIVDIMWETHNDNEVISTMSMVILQKYNQYLEDNQLPNNDELLGALYNDHHVKLAIDSARTRIKDQKRKGDLQETENKRLKKTG